jgi:enoyl-CoA hydratase
MADEDLLVERVDASLMITLNRPARRNALTSAMIGMVIDALDELESDGGLRAAVLTGAGETFCSGGDLSAGSTDLEARRYVLRDLVTRERSKPLIAAVNGPAVGGGFELILACDLVIATENARFCLPEVRRGRLPAGGSLLRLPEALSRQQAAWLLLTGDWLSCAEAQAYGLVNQMVAPGAEREAALALAAKIARSAPLPVAEIVATLCRGNITWDELSECARRLKFSADAAEGAAAFLEKRDPVWTAR